MLCSCSRFRLFIVTAVFVPCSEIKATKTSKQRTTTTTIERLKTERAKTHAIETEKY